MKVKRILEKKQCKKKKKKKNQNRTKQKREIKGWESSIYIYILAYLFLL